MEDTPTHIVGIGASAGGLQPLESMFDKVPVDTGMAFVIIQHLSPDFKSLMDELLARHTEMPIHKVIDGIQVQANNIYLIPPKKNMVIKGNCLRLSDKDEGKALNLPIDIFFESLAEDVGEKSIAVILSGTGSDGSRSLPNVASAGGLVIVQDPESAGFDGMPKNAIESGFADFVVEPQIIPEVLSEHKNSSLSSDGKQKLQRYELGNRGKFAELFSLLNEHYNIDFTYYKTGTVDRRIERRRKLLNLESIEKYAQVLRQDETELENLSHDLLIGVTKFFRDTSAFQQLSEKVIPDILGSTTTDREVRVWVCGCATGEEAYSIAILLREELEMMQSPRQVKVFATDVHKTALEKASSGIYSVDALEVTSPEIREKYFTKEGENYRIKSMIRQMVVFSEQNLLKDPPFTKIDLITCRNLLIYFQVIAQKKAIAMFHFALRHKGYLFLGTSENLGGFEEEFETVSRSWKIFSKKRDVRLTPDLRIPLGPPQNRAPDTSQLTATVNIRDAQLFRVYDAVFERYMHSALLINERRELIHIFGRAGTYFKTPAAGRVSNDVVNMFEGDLRIALTAGIQRSLKDYKTATFKGVYVNLPDEETVKVNLTVEPLSIKAQTDVFLLITIDEPKQTSSKVISETENVESFNVGEVSTERINNLEQELQYNREQLQTTVEELETSNEELQASNEEMIASNEELQSTNEELHSLNEELYTVNGEYERKNDELEQLNSDMDNLLRSTKIGTLFVDHSLKVRKYTDAIAQSLNLLPQDIGRPIEHITSNLKGENDLVHKIKEVIQTKQPIEREVENREGHYFLERILPYFNNKDQVNGAVVTLINIDTLKKAENDLRESEKKYKLLSKSLTNVIWESDTRGAFVNRQPDWEEYSGQSWEEYKDFGWTNSIHEDDRKNVEKLWCDALTNKVPYFASGRMWSTAHQNYRYFKATALPYINDEGEITSWIGNVTDVHEKTEAEKILKANKEDLEKELSIKVDALIESEEVNKTVVDASRAAVWVLDLDQNTIRWNDNFRNIFNFNQLEIDNARGWWIKQIAPDYSEDYEAKLNQYLENPEGVLKVEYQIKDGKGKPRYVRDCAILLRAKDGKGRRLIGSIIDLTEQQESIQRLEINSEELAREKTRLENVLNMVNDGYWEWNMKNMDEEFMSPKFKAMFGYEDHELPNTPDSWKKLIHPDDLEVTEKNFELHLNEGKPYEQIVRYYHKNGSIVWVICRGVILRDEKGDPDIMIGTHTNITELKTAEQKLKATLEKLASSNKQLEQFAHIASHDLQEPLRMITSYVQLIDSKFRDEIDEEGAKYLNYAVDGSLRMRAMIKSLLEYSKINSKELELRKINLDQIFEQILNDLQIQIKETEAVVKKGDLPSIHGDPSLIEMVFRNLVQNALKFGGDQKPEIEIYATDGDDEMVTIAVRDKGIGIDMEQKDRIFKIFQRLHRDDSIEGTGLGLSIVDAVVKRHSGRVDLQSTPGEGSIFLISLPLNHSNER
ncbi:MAG: PAS domain-containing protein [Opitutales bacterium]|nr:PAS domain-containing protein [Opitutales bacterium]